MFIKANPDRGKSEEEKKADRDKFQYGESVLPKLRRRGGEGDEEERRVLESVQALSLRELGIETDGPGNTLELPRERRTELSSDGPGQNQNMRSADDRRSRSRNASSAASVSSREVVPPRVVEHQSSLRSLLSASEVDSQEMEEEIMRQIMEDGLLDGIDLNNIDVSQEDEISERIAQAYRRRQTERQRERRERRERLAREEQISTGHSMPPELRSPAARDDEQGRRRPRGQAESGTLTLRDRDSGPPVSRPRLLVVANQGRGTRHRRSSSQDSSRSARAEHRPAPLAVSSARTADFSQTDLGGRSAQPVTASLARRRQSDNQQRSTLEERQQLRNDLQPYSFSNPNSPQRSAFHVPTMTESLRGSAGVASSLGTSPSSSTPTTVPSQPPSSRRTTDPIGARHARPSNSNTATPPTTASSSSPPLAFPRSTADQVESHTRLTSFAAPVAPTVYMEPNITCRSCGKEHIEYDLHYNCSRCDSGTYNLCQSCYRLGRGCRHWYGFGWAAWPNYQKRAPAGGYPAPREYPHVLRGHKYRKPQAQLTENNAIPNALMSEDEPHRRLEAGVFCDICTKWANACYWKCDYCNEGEWGYCNDCVNQGLHCTHALLPVTHVGKEQISVPQPPYDGPSSIYATHGFHPRP